MKPTRFAIVIGAMKAGTTHLFEQLASHPDLVPCAHKEPNFFSQDTNHAKGFEHYRSLWPSMPSETAYALEASTTYTKRLRFTQVPERMKRAIEDHGVEIKLIYCLRHPLDRIRSQLTHALRVGDTDLNLDGIRSGWIEGHALSVSMYAHQLDAYRSLFDQEDILLVRFEEMAADPAQTLDTIAEFLGLAEHAWPPAQAPRNPSAGRYQKGMVWEGLERSGLIKLADMVPDRIRSALRERLGHRMEGKIELTPEQAVFYRSALAHDLARLEREHGFDTSPWNLSPRELENKAKAQSNRDPEEPGR